MLSQKAKKLKPSPTLALAAKAKDLQKQGLDVVSLAVGEPDWPSFNVANKAGIDAINRGETKYTITSGILELREEICRELNSDLGIQYKAKEVVVGSGAKFILFSALNMICDHGDEILIPSPYWVSYPTMVELAGGTPVIVTTTSADSFKLTPSALKKAITPKTKALILCSPSNPTGLVYTAQELEALAGVLDEYPGILIISDDIYNRLVFSEQSFAPHILQVAPHLRDRVLIVNGASKSYSMTGWRIGWGVGPETLIAAMADYQSQSTSNPSSIGQWAALAAIKDGEAELKASLVGLKSRRDKFYSQLCKIAELNVPEPQGAFYFWIGIEKVLGRTFEGRLIANSKEFCEVFLEKFYVSTVPGIEFGQEGYIRMSYVVAEAQMAKAIERLQKFIQQLKP
jgi:aspartate aminotransferase